jgi:hypothetical protein
MLLCRPVEAPVASPSRTRSPDPKVVGESWVDDAWTATMPRGAAESRATSPLVADAGLASSPHAVEARERAAVADVRAVVSPSIIGVNPISARPVRADDLVKDQPQIDQVPRVPGTSGS